MSNYEEIIRRHNENHKRLTLGILEREKERLYMMMIEIRNMKKNNSSNNNIKRKNEMIELLKEKILEKKEEIKKIIKELGIIDWKELSEIKVIREISNFFDEKFTTPLIMIKFIEDTYYFKNLKDSEINNIIEQINKMVTEDTFRRNDYTRRFYEDREKELISYFKNIIKENQTKESMRGGSKTHKNKKSKKVKSRKMRK